MAVDLDCIFYSNAIGITRAQPGNIPLHAFRWRTLSLGRCQSGGPRLVVERKRRRERERERKETAEAAGTADTADTAETTAGAS
jgi:DNA topoisomerase IA